MSLAHGKNGALSPEAQQSPAKKLGTTSPDAASRQCRDNRRSRISKTLSDDAFRRLYLGSTPTPKIGEICGVGADAVRNHAARLGLPPRPAGKVMWREYRLDDDGMLDLLALYRRGISAARIARTLGLPSRNAALGLIHRVIRDDIAASAPLESVDEVRAGYR